MAFDTLRAVMELDYTGVEHGIKGVMNSISKAIGDPKTTGLDMAKLFNANFTSLNWTTIIGKLFTPGNLIAFFSAMAAVGIVQAVQQQNLQANVAGTTGATPAASAATTAAAVTVFRNLGTNVGSLQDVQKSITSFTALTGSIKDAETITTALGKAAETTGITLNDVLPNLVTFLQNAGISSEPAIITVIDNLMQATQASGGLESMGQIAGQLADFGTAAQAAQSPLSAISTEIVAFGASIKTLGTAQATANLQLLNASLEGTQAGLIASGKDKAQFDLMFNTQGPVTAMADIANHVSQLTPAMSGLVGEALGLDENAVVGAQAFLAVRDAIQAAADTANKSMGPALADINTQWDQTDTTSREISKAMALIETAFMQTDQFANDLNKTMQNAGSTIMFAPGVPSLTDALLQLSKTTNPNPSLKAGGGATNVNQNITINGASPSSTKAAVQGATTGLNNMVNGQAPNAGKSNATSTGGLFIFGFTGGGG